MAPAQTVPAETVNPDPEDNAELSAAVPAPQSATGAAPCDAASVAEAAAARRQNELHNQRVTAAKTDATACFNKVKLYLQELECRENMSAADIAATIEQLEVHRQALIQHEKNVAVFKECANVAKVLAKWKKQVRSAHSQLET